MPAETVALGFAEQIRLRAFILVKRWVEEASRDIGVAVLSVRHAAAGQPVPREDAARILRPLDSWAEPEL